MAKTLEDQLKDVIADDTTPDDDKPADNAPPSDDPSPANDAGDETPGDEDEPDDDAEWFKDYEAAFGDDLSGQFKTAAEAMKHLNEARHKIGERDEDAQYGRGLKTLLAGREAELAKFLSGDSEKPKDTKPAKPGNLDTMEVQDFPEEAYTWAHQIRQDDNGKLVPAPDAPPDIVDRYQAFQRALQRRLVEMAREYPALKALPDKIKADATQNEEAAAEAAEHQAILDLQTKYRKVLFVEGAEEETAENFTAIGKEVNAKQTKLLAKHPGMTRVGAIEEAIEFVLGRHKGNKTAAPATKASKRRDSVNVDKKEYKSLDDEVSKRLDAGERLDVVMPDVARRLGSQALG